MIRQYEDSTSKSGPKIREWATINETHQQGGKFHSHFSFYYRNLASLLIISTEKIRVLSYNILSDAIFQSQEYLDEEQMITIPYEQRNVLILKEIEQYAPDVLCLQVKENSLFFLNSFRK